MQVWMLPVCSPPYSVSPCSKSAASPCRACGAGNICRRSPDASSDGTYPNRVPSKALRYTLRRSFRLYRSACRPKANNKFQCGCRARCRRAARSKRTSIQRNTNDDFLVIDCRVERRRLSLRIIYATSFAAEASFAVLCTTIYFMSFAQDSTGTFKSYLLGLKDFHGSVPLFFLLSFTYGVLQSLQQFRQPRNPARRWQQDFP